MGVRLHLIFAVYVIICPKYFLLFSLNMDFVIANSSDTDEMTHHVAFHLGLPCSMKYPIRGFCYTKACHLLYLGTKVVMFYNGSNSLKLLLCFCQMMNGFRVYATSFLTRICQRSRPLAAMFLSDQVCLSVLQWITEEISLPNFIQF